MCRSTFVLVTPYGPRSTRDWRRLRPRATTSPWVIKHVKKRFEWLVVPVSLFPFFLTRSLGQRLTDVSSRLFQLSNLLFQFLFTFFSVSPCLIPVLSLSKVLFLCFGFCLSLSLSSFLPYSLFSCVCVWVSSLPTHFSSLFVFPFLTLGAHSIPRLWVCPSVVG